MYVSTQQSGVGHNSFDFHFKSRSLNLSKSAPMNFSIRRNVSSYGKGKHRDESHGSIGSRGIAPLYLWSQLSRGLFFPLDLVS